MLKEEMKWVRETASSIATEAVDVLRREIEAKLADLASEKKELKKKPAGMQSASEEE